MRKQACCLLAAALLLSGGVLPVLAAETPSPAPSQTIPMPQPTHVIPDPEETSVVYTEPKESEKPTGQETKYIGRIVPSLVSVTVPLAVDFEMDPDVAVELSFDEGSATVSQVTSPETAKVVNQSNMPVTVSVTTTKDKTVEDGKTLTLVNTLDAAAEPGNALLVLAGAATPGPGEPSALSERLEGVENLADFEGRALPDPDAVPAPAAPIPVMTLDAGEARTLGVYGKAAPGAGYVFSFKATFRVEPVKKADPPAETTGNAPD